MSSRLVVLVPRREKSPGVDALFGSLEQTVMCLRWPPADRVTPPKKTSERMCGSYDGVKVGVSVTMHTMNSLKS